MNIQKIRQDFPVLQKKVRGRPIIYFDNACMSLRPVQVIQKLQEYYEEFPACHGRSVHKLSNRLTHEFELARQTIQKFIGARKPEEIIFTKNCTEAINLVAYCLKWNPNEVVLNSDREHSSNIVPWLKLQNERKIKRVWIPAKPDESFDLDAYEQELKKQKVRLVSVVWTSNLDGYTLPVKEIIKLAHKHEAMVLLDGAQAVPHFEVNVRKLDVDFLTFSSHKMCGPNGVGVLYGKKELLEKLNQFIVGGDTISNTTYASYKSMPIPEKFEAGLQNYPGVIGLAEACRYLQKIGMREIEKHVSKLDQKLKEGLSEIPRAKILGNKEARAGVTSFVLEGMNYHDLALILDGAANIAVRSGQHCVHSWFNSRHISGSVRASLYFYNTEEEVEIFLKTLKKIVKYL